jgi:hypothetical protein
VSTSENTSGDEFELACKNCGERNPSHFAICWNCGESLENAEQVVPIEEPELDEELEQAPPVASDIPFGHWTQWYELTAILLITFVHRIIGLAIYSGWKSGPDTTADAIDYLSQLPWYIGMSMLLWILIRRDKEVKQPIALTKCNWWIEIAFALAIVFANFPIVRAVGAFAFRIGLSNARSARIAVTGADEWAALLLYWLVATLYEEVLFRVYFVFAIEN